MPKVSVITPVYNVEPYIRQCLDSLCAQTLEEIEFVCVDDGSTDGCPAILEEYASKDQRFRVITQPNGGYGKAVNHGIAQAQGEYIGIIEPDDYVEPACFEVLYELAKRHGTCDIAKANYYKFDESSEKLIEGFKEDVCGCVLSSRGEEGVLMVKSAPSIWAAIYRREFLDGNGIRCLETPGASFQDTGFVMKSWIAAESVVFTHDAFVHYRSGNAGSSKMSSGKVFCVCEEFASIDRFAKERLADGELLARALAHKRYTTYQWNLERIDGKYRKAFLHAGAREFCDDEARGLHDRAMFSKKQWTHMRKWMSDPDGLLLNMRIDDAKKRGSASLLPLKVMRKLRKLRKLVK